MKLTDFANNQQKTYAIYDNYRSITSFIDGLKPSGRKLVWNSHKFKIFKKVDTIANATASDTQYLHGPVNMEGVLKGICNDYSGTNLIPLFSKEGFFGTRTETEPGASRYIKAKQSDILYKLYRKEDDNVLINQEFEGFKIEPQFYIPILPTVLINGSSGIGNGFAHDISTRHPKEIAECIFKHLDNKDFNIPLPYFVDFKGTIIQDIQNNLKFFIKGNFEIKNTTTIIIDELPIGYTLSKYIKTLNILEENGVIKNFIDKSNKNKFLFELKVPRTTSSLSVEQLQKTFSLVTSFTENVTCIGLKNEIVEYKSIKELLLNYIDIRLKFYNLRKAYRIKELNKVILVLANKISFITLVQKGNIDIQNQSKISFTKQLQEKEFDKVDKSFDYLLNMNFLNLTSEVLNRLKKELIKLGEELVSYSEKDIKDMWKDEINELLVALGEKKIRNKKIMISNPQSKNKFDEELSIDNLF